MKEIEKLYIKIKNAEIDNFNLIFDKEFLQKFILMTLLIVKDNKLFNDLENNKKDKYLKSLEQIINLFY